MENYFNKQRDGTLAQIKNLYEEKDVTFRGFRQGDGAGGGKGQYIPKEFMKKGAFWHPNLGSKNGQNHQCQLRALRLS